MRPTAVRIVMNIESKITRRDFLRLSMMAVVAAALPKAARELPQPIEVTVDNVAHRGIALIDWPVLRVRDNSGAIIMQKSVSQCSIVHIGDEFIELKSGPLSPSFNCVLTEVQLIMDVSQKHGYRNDKFTPLPLTPNDSVEFTWQFVAAMGDEMPAI